MPAPLHTSTDALRHVLVTLADRFEHAVGDAPSGFAAFEAGNGARTPLALVRHLRRLMRFAAALWTGRELDEAPPLDWVSEVAAWRQDPGLRLYGSDGFHPTVLGSYLAALVIYGGLITALGVSYDVVFFGGAA